MSVPSNIAEGYGRRTKNEYIQFLHIALGSLRELDTQLIIAKEVKLVAPELSRCARKAEGRGQEAEGWVIG